MQARALLSLSVFSIMALLVIPRASAQEEPSQEDLDAIVEAIERVESRIDNTSTERSQIEDQLFAAEKELSELSSSIETVEQQLEAEEQRLDSLHAQQAELEASKARQQDTIARYLRSAWQTGREEYLKLLLNQENISQTARAVRYYQYFNEARAEKIATWNQTLSELSEVESEIQATTASLEQNRRQLTRQRNELEQGQTRRQRILAELEQVLEQSGEELARLEQQRQEITLLIEELNRSVRNMTQQQPFAELKGELPWPVEGPLLNSFGSRHDLGDLNWQGVNISVDPGTEVRAIHHGRVVYADWFGSSGLLLIIDHGDGYMSLYAQNEQLFHEVGDWVNSGEVIVSAGNTGGRRDTSLYFEIRYQGRSQDPVAWCMTRN